jgi:hypothetical protein
MIQKILKIVIGYMKFKNSYWKLLLIFCILFIGFSIPIYSQDCIKVVNETGKSIELVNVIIADSSQNIVWTGSTNSEGQVDPPIDFSKKIFVSLSHVSYQKIDFVPFVTEGDCMEFTMKFSSNVLDEVWFYSDRIIPAGEIQMRKADFLQIAGSFDDPSRLLTKNEAITVVNDQNNAISFQGMPSHYNKWQINGGDVVNPNHLSNAGTSFDIYSPSAGGVNIISGQVIDNFNYRSPTAKGYESNQFSGTASLHLSDSIGKYAQISLIGLESGGHFKAGNTNVVANLRYSFTGLLALMGVDFGGEVINYKDVVLGFSNKSKPLKWNTYFIYGDDSNKKGENIWESKTFMFSNQLEWNAGNWKINHITNYSQKNTSLPVSVPWNDAADQLFYHKTQLVNGDFGINLVLRDQKMESIFAISQNTSHGFLSIQPNYSKRINDNWSIYAELPIIYEYTLSAKLKLAQKLQISFNNDLLKWSAAYSTQNIGSGGMILMDSTLDIKSQHFQTDIALNNVGLRPSVSFFYNSILNPIYSFDEVWGDASQNLLPMDFPFMRAEQGKTYGLTGSVKPRLGKNSGLQINATVFRSLVMSELNVEDFSQENGFTPSTNDMKYLASGNIYRYFDRRKGRIFVSLGFVSRGNSLRYVYSPTNDNTIKQANFSIQEGKTYFRIDTRISYQRKKYSLSLDLQNLTNRVNDFSYGLTQPWGSQLGLLPNLSYRYSFE